MGKSYRDKRDDRDDGGYGNKVPKRQPIVERKNRTNNQLVNPTMYVDGVEALDDMS